MGSPTEFWTLNSSEFPSAAVACSLSDVLETGALPPRYFLSATACAGILRRAQKRGKVLPPFLKLALLQAVQAREPISSPDKLKGEERQVATRVIHALPQAGDREGLAGRAKDDEVDRLDGFGLDFCDIAEVAATGETRR
jgi:hypothetical protein